MPATESAPGEICLRAIDGFHVGGAVHTLRGLPVETRRLAQGAEPRPVDPNGDHVVGQMYVQAYRLARPRHALPVLFWHGGGMTGANWETTPDGRPGWLWRFLSAGYDVYVSDAVERGRASWARYPELYRDAPLFRSLEEAWDMFRMGPADGYRTDPAGRRAHPGQQFPVGAFEQFARQWVPRWAGHEAITSAAYRALLDRVGPCIVIGHSQGGGFSLLAAQERPVAVRAVVALEPSGAPGAGQAGTQPHLLVWGDHIADHPIWRRYRATVDAYAAALAGRGAPVGVLDLPADGMRGNSHFLMMDRNSDLIADRVLHWLDALDLRHS